MILDYYESPLKRKYKAVLTKPHQPFFILGIAVAIWNIAILGFAVRGKLDIDITTFHTFGMSALMPTALFLGFLFTVLYRFLLVMPFLQKDYMSVFWVLLASTLISQIGFFADTRIALFGMVLLSIAQAMALRIFVSAYVSSTVKDKSEILLILSAFASGIIGSVLFAASIFYPAILSFAVSVSFYVFAVGVVFMVAQKMIPNFFTIYFSVEQPQKSIPTIALLLVSLIGVAIARGALSQEILLVSNAIGLAVTTAIFWKNRFIFRKAPPILWVLQLGSAWLWIGFVAGIAEAIGIAYFNNLSQAHIFGIGFITTLIIGFGSRVSMGHSGRKIVADKSTTLIFSLMFLMVPVRLIGIYVPFFIDISVALWSFIFIFWTYKYLPMLLSD
ncbi:MAG: NnrS family protein [Campylobacterales bacterium]